MKTHDPQIVVTGRLKATEGGTEIIVFNVNLLLFQLVCIVNIPGEDETTAPVYVKFKVRNSSKKENQDGSEHG